MFARLDAETRTTIKRIFGLKDVESLRMVDMQCQEGTSDCGLFAIAAITSLLFGEDPSNVVYSKEKGLHTEQHALCIFDNFQGTVAGVLNLLEDNHFLLQ